MRCRCCLPICPFCRNVWQRHVQRYCNRVVIFLSRAASNSVRDGAGGGVGPARAHGGVARHAGRAGRGGARGGLAARQQDPHGARRRSPRYLEHPRSQTHRALLPTRLVLYLMDIGGECRQSRGRPRAPIIIFILFINRLFLSLTR